MAFDQNQYVADYKRQNYDVIRALIPKGRSKDVKAYAKARGLSVSQVIVEALEVHCKLDLSKVGGE